MTVDLFGAIPPVIFHSHDLIGDDQLDRGVDGYAFVEPTKNSIWPTIRQGGIYPNFRSINPLAMVETRICIKDDALNTSWLSSLPSTLELTDAIGPTPLQIPGCVCVTGSVQVRIRNPPLGCLLLLFVKFCYYK